MSGHSKWSQIKRKKGKADQERGKLFSKLIREITVAARSGGPPEGNPRLRSAILTAKAANMPADNIERAVKKGTGELPGVVYEEVTYEGYGPGGVAILVHCLTDNRNRTTNDVRHVFTKHGGNLGGAGSVAWKFETRGVITVERRAVDEDALLTVVLDAGALDVDTGNSEAYEVLAAPGSLEAVRQALTQHQIPVAASEVTKIPQNTMTIDPGEAVKVVRLMEVLEELDDVQRVWSDVELSDEVMAKLGG
ncbi:MAG TPA: YebC/PmpR family DNA-binding transcriptional regulator [Candidatus Saccharimonadales bacterium]|nr:YebC/PmpR family DNA-binding transcriptional regulator [Candidatus Saccharimonadales bacterium]